MADNDFDCVVILEDNFPVGILTTKDIMDLIKNTSDLTLPVSSYMSSPVESLDEYSSIKEAIKDNDIDKAAQILKLVLKNKPEKNKWIDDDGSETSTRAFYETGG